MLELWGIWITPSLPSFLALVCPRVVVPDRLQPMGQKELNNDIYKTQLEGCPRGVMVKAMDGGIVVREFVLQSDYYVHFRANTLGKGMNPLILPAMG